MTNRDKITLLRRFVGDEEPEEVLTAYLNLAESKMVARLYPYKEDEELPSKYDILMVECAAYMLNKEWDGASIPDHIVKQLVPMCGTV